jgi:hypothetical protein
MPWLLVTVAGDACAQWGGKRENVGGTTLGTEASGTELADTDIGKGDSAFGGSG